MQHFHTVSVVVVLMGLAGCGGSSAGDPIALPELNDIYSDEITANFSDPQRLTTDALLAKGSADYAGYAFIVPDDTFNNINGRVAISADFTNGGSLTGAITDLVQIDEDAAIFEIDPQTEQEFIANADALVQLDGSFVLSNGNIQEQAAFSEIDVDLDGSVTIPARLSGTNSDETYTLDGALTGTILETNNLVVFGDVVGESSDVSTLFGFAVVGLEKP